jgi:hypothetical protein
MVETANLGQLRELAHARRVYPPRLGCIFVQQQVGSGSVVVGKIGSENAVQVVLAEDDYMIETLSPYRAYKTFRIGILPRAARRCEHLLDAHAFDTTVELFTVDAVAIADHVLGCSLLRESLDHLLGGPGRAWE